MFVELIDFFNCDDIAVQCSLYLLQFSLGFYSLSEANISIQILNYGIELIEGSSMHADKNFLVVMQNLFCALIEKLWKIPFLTDYFRQ